MLSTGEVVVVNDPSIVTINNQLGTVAIVADGLATDYFIRRTVVSDAIESISFAALPAGAGNTIYRVSIGTAEEWFDSQSDRQQPGAASLGSFTGFGTAGSTPTDSSYYVQLRVGVSDQLGNIRTNELVRADAKRIGLEFQNADWVISGRVQTVRAGEININFLNNIWDTTLNRSQFDPNLSVPWPYNASEEDRYRRGNVDLISTRGTEIDYPDATGDIRFVMSSSRPVPGSIDRVLARGSILSAPGIYAHRKVNVLEASRDVFAFVHAGLGGDRVIAGEIQQGVGAMSGGNIQGKYLYDYPITPFVPQEGDQLIRLVRAVKLGENTGNLSGQFRAKALQSTNDINDQIRIDGDFQSGYIVLSDGLPAGKLLVIGGSAQAQMTFGNANDPANTVALAGQVIVNQTNMSGLLADDVFVDGNALQNRPLYINNAASLGGGAVGVAPFALHKEDSVPTAATTPSQIRLWQFTKQSWARAYSGSRPNNLFTKGQEDEEGFILARFYGPIQSGSGSNALMKIEQFDSITNSWTDVSSLFTSWLRPANGSSFGAPAALNRDVLVAPDSIESVPKTYCTSEVYRMRPANIVCNFVMGQPAVADFEYKFEVIPELSPADLAGEGAALGGDGFHDNNDFIAFTDQFFNQTLLGDFAGSGGSFGPDGVWDNNDFIAFIQIFFEAPAALIGSCDDSDASPSIPFELPESLQTADPETDRQLNALWITLSRTSDPRVANRLVDTLFGGAN